jgi:hypothetical protein
VFLSDESFDAWRDFCDQHGVSVTAMIEAMGLALKQLPERPSGVVADVVKEARRIDGQRRRGTRRL